MSSPQAPKACAEHELPGEDKNGKRLKQVQRGQWLRATILGANDGLLSTTSLMLGVGAAKEDQWYMILSGLAGAVAGACSMAVGEFVSVSCQRDIEKATSCSRSSSRTKLCEQGNGDDVKLNIITSVVGTTRIDTNPAIINPDLSPAVTPLRTILGKKLVCDGEKLTPFMTPATTPEQKSPLMVASSKSPSVEEPSGDAKTALAQDRGEEEEDEEDSLPNPYKAASVSALAFLGGSVVPLLPAMLFAHNTSRVLVIVAVASIALALSGGIGAYLGGSSVRLSAVRVLLGGWIAMAVTYGLLKPLEREGKGHGDTD